MITVGRQLNSQTRTGVIRSIKGEIFHRHALAKKQERLRQLPELMEAAKCRRLEGAEFAYWKAIYEARDREERARREDRDL